MTMNINIEDILRKSSWKNANSFCKFYHIDILNRADHTDCYKIIEV